MKRVNLSMTRCVKCKSNIKIISEKIMKRCPICNSELVKDKEFNAQGILDHENGCIILKEKGIKYDSNRSKDIKKG